MISTPHDELLEYVQKLYEKGHDQQIVDLLTADLLNHHNSVRLNKEKGKAYFGIAFNHYQNEDFHTAIEFFKKADSLNPHDIDTHFNLAYCYEQIGEFEEAISLYHELLETNYEDGEVHYNLGNSWLGLKNFEKAAGCYSKALELNYPNIGLVYNNLGNVYYELDDFEEAKKCFLKAMRVDPIHPLFMRNYAETLKRQGKYEKAIESFEKYLELDITNEWDTYEVEEWIRESKKFSQNKGYSQVVDTISRIKSLLEYEGKDITHYTSLSVSQKLVLNSSQFRLSEGAFLNDTSEGTELFESLDQPELLIENTKNVKEEIFAQKPFIGSFVMDTKYNDLTLWRMYGKEGNEEGKGCAITLDRRFLIDELKKKLEASKKKGVSSKIKEELKFYRVAYFKKKHLDFILELPESNEQKVKELSQSIQKLRQLVKKYYAANTELAKRIDLKEALNEIAFLFKSSEYVHENEVRLIIRGIGFRKNISEESLLPPKVYIELAPIDDFIKRITLGPKIQRAEEWASSFYYSLLKKGKKISVIMSRLPYK